MPWVVLTKPNERLITGSGFRLALPIGFCWWRRGYDIVNDWFMTGWWLWSLALFVAPIASGKHRHGLSFRLVWGWTPLSKPRSVAGSEATV